MFSRRIALSAWLVSPVLAPSAWAQTTEPFPNRPIRLVVPYAPGTATDLLARTLTPRFSDVLGQRMVVENRAGAGGIVGAEAVARATPDGYTLGFAGSQTNAINVSLYRSLPYNPQTDFTPIARIAAQPMVLVVNPDLPVRSVAELVALAKARPGELNFASTGSGTSAHLSGEALRSQAAIDIVHVPYASSGQVFTELLAGRTQLMFYPYQPLKPHIDAGRLRALATTGETRPAWLPDLPTMIEAGYSNFVVIPWFALFGPAGTPQAAVATLSAATERVLADPDLRAALAATGTEPWFAGPLVLADFTQAEIARYREVITASGARVD
ncbi:Bug family tripartite tricarboxylate transporter substrate binding protein [Neoroseomonas lacus]|uniref:ABC transporter substrate-binding protein n=1 Tax=Neoroseomonas lacus TaxID=287609 RepID=A0A917K993_9PROT|nr:tripartite tricarboxylate transporter substrate binding protein [Neoroseomonas lacus]GGJ05509.1 ABC transporter substrate-binding protein [Neoroseomonas lacus]